MKKILFLLLVVIFSVSISATNDPDKPKIGVVDSLIISQELMYVMVEGETFIAWEEELGKADYACLKQSVGKMVFLLYNRRNEIQSFLIILAIEPTFN